MRRQIRRIAALCLLLAMLLGGCRGIPGKKREAVRELTCTTPAIISGMQALTDGKAAVCQIDYEAERTTVQVIDTVADKVSAECTLAGAWELKAQGFQDGRIALYCREEGVWKFLDSALRELGTWARESGDGFFSYDGTAYYALQEEILCRWEVGTETFRRVELATDLRIREITAFDAPSGRMAVQFLLSPYGSDLGTAILHPDTGGIDMLSAARYQVSFSLADGACLLAYDEEAAGYSATYGAGEDFRFAAPEVFRAANGDLYAPAGGQLLLNPMGESRLYTLGEEVAACSLAENGVSGAMYHACMLPEGLMLGAAFRDWAFHLYVLGPAQLTAEQTTAAEEAVSPVAVDEGLAASYWTEVTPPAVADSLQEARTQADELEEAYGVRILLSEQCREAADLCDLPITLSDSLPREEELARTVDTLSALRRVFALYPEGFLAQMRTGMGEGGICFLLIGEIESDYGAIGCTYERGDWQYIALDIRQTVGMDGLICHEVWHATENEILSRDYTAFSPDEWAEINPQGFTYSEDATVVPDEQRLGWTMYGASPEKVYFVDTYAEVDEKEDRARIMEYFMTYEDEAKLLIQSPAIREKLRRMSTAIRKCFDTTGWDAVTRWERLF